MLSYNQILYICYQFERDENSKFHISLGTCMGMGVASGDSGILLQLVLYTDRTLINVVLLHLLDFGASTVAASNETDDDNESKAVHTFHKGQRFSRKLQRRLTMRTVAEARALKKHSKEAIHVLIYAAELVNWVDLHHISSVEMIVITHFRPTPNRLQLIRS